MSDRIIPQGGFAASTLASRSGDPVRDTNCPYGVPAQPVSDHPFGDGARTNIHIETPVERPLQAAPIQPAGGGFAAGLLVVAVFIVVAFLAYSMFGGDGVAADPGAAPIVATDPVPAPADPVAPVPADPVIPAPADPVVPAPQAAPANP